MKAAVIHEFGGPEVLRYEDVPDPQTRKDQILVRVKACALNHLDLWVRKGLPGVKLPHILGSDIAGEIAAIQIAKMFNATVIATAGDERKIQKAKELGADYVINHYQQKIGDEARKITNKAGVDIVIEHVGAATWNESMKALKPGGTLVTCGATSGPEVSFDLRFLFARQLALLGSYMGTMGELHEVLKLVFSGKLKPVVDKTFPLKDTRAAHEYLEQSKMFGKVVLIP